MKRNFAACALLPAAFIYNAASKIHFVLRGVNPVKSKKPVICVGNIMAGGVGKTPIVREIAKFLPNSGVMARMRDEAAMLGAVSGPRRGVLPLMQKYKYIIMDDGFQDSGVAKDISILVFDGEMGIGNGFILPAGPLRESLESGLRRADAVVIIGKDKTNLKEKIENTPVFFAERKFASEKFGSKIAAFSGIGYPEKFFKSLEEVSGKKLAARIPFPDHHEFTSAELLKLSAIKAELWTTEKDAVRLPAGFARVLKMEIEIGKEFWKWLASKTK
ncbi:MAG: tetraacyldisaccharide 4'-kinase [Rickettsiales bacterium]|nr:tetraacyldisaccharide 4'-kinase [Rickettsiales bacterium]